LNVRRHDLPARRCATIGLLASIFIVANGAAFALDPARGGVVVEYGAGSFYVPSRGARALGFGFDPWWGPNDTYGPPGYSSPPVPLNAPSARASGGLPAPPGRAVGVCREFESTVIVDGQPRIAHGLACPQPDGTWRIVR
jgi:hypothetical protein